MSVSECVFVDTKNAQTWHGIMSARLNRWWAVGLHEYSARRDMRGIEGGVDYIP